MYLQQVLEKYFPLISNMLLPAFIFAVGLFGFLLNNGFSYEISLLFHWCFFGLSLLTGIFLLYLNQSRLLFFMAVVFVSYILINYIKFRFGIDFTSTIWFQNLAVIVPFNLLVFYLYFGRRFLSHYSLVILLMIMVEYSVAEFLGRAEISLAFLFKEVNLSSVLGFSLLCIWALVRAVKDGNLFDYSVLFASFGVCLGLVYASVSGGVSLFFFMAQLILTVFIGYDFIYNHYYDEATGFFNRTSYLRQSVHFPSKYSLAVINVDSYDKLLSSFGRQKMNIIVGLIAEVLQDLAVEETIYRYTADKFIVIYKTLNQKETHSAANNICKTVSELSFALSDLQKPFKLTLSCGVSEKKRSDVGAVEVLARADKARLKELRSKPNRQMNLAFAGS